MEELTEAGGELLPPNPIRVETALSRYPVHRLAKHGVIAIDIRERNADGETSIKWEVNHVGKFGQPGPLAYKVDTLIINRRIEEASRPIPRIIRLGSLKEIAAQLDLGGDTNLVKKALRQNASTFIIAQIDYRRPDGSTRKLEADFTRYSVVFTGEELPNGRKADAVYIILNDVYMQVINGAMTRPLDYDYLKILPPAAQRFYELLSFQMYAAIKNDRPRAKLLYSELCTYAPLTKHTDWEHARKQLAKIHAPHKQSGYIGKIDFNEIADRDGKPDWIMLYQPGPKARAEYRHFAKRGGPVMLEVEPFDAQPAPLPLLERPPAPSPLAAELIARGVTPAIASALLIEHDEDSIRQQMDIFDAMPAKKRDKIEEPAAWLVTAIRNGHAAPKGYVPREERERRAEAKRQKEQQAAEERRRTQERQAREKAERQAILGYWESLTPEQQAAHDAEAIAQADGEDLELIKPGPMQRIGMCLLRDKYTRRLLETQGKLLPERG